MKVIFNVHPMTKWIVILILLVGCFIFVCSNIAKGAERPYRGIRIIYTDPYFYECVTDGIDSLHNLNMEFDYYYKNVAFYATAKSLVTMREFKVVVQFLNSKDLMVNYNFVDVRHNANGYFWERYPNAIFVKQGMNKRRTMLVILHELVHVYNNMNHLTKKYDIDEHFARMVTKKAAMYYGYSAQQPTDDTLVFQDPAIIAEIINEPLSE